MVATYPAEQWCGRWPNSTGARWSRSTLTSRPLGVSGGTDFRTVTTPRVSGTEAILDTLIRRLLARQDLLRSALLDDEAQPFPFVGSVSLTDDVPVIVGKLRSTLGISLDAFRAARSKEEAFRLLRTRVEDAGVFVLQIGNLGSYHTDIDVGVFRGASLADRIAPFVIINPHDAPSARCFTLLHELAHVWLGHTGVSGGLPEGPVERFCNDVASEYLLPADEFVPPRVTGTAAAAWAKTIEQYAADRNVSSTMVAYRLFRAGHIGEPLWMQLRQHFRARWLTARDRHRKQLKQQEGGPGYYQLQRNQLGSNLVESTGRLMASGALTTTKAGRILGVQPKIVHALLAES